MILSDKEIHALAEEHGMITPFVPESVRVVNKDNAPVRGAAEARKEKGERRIASYGLGSYGYDIRLGNTFKVFSNALQVEVDPKQFDARAYVDVSVPDGDFVRVPPNSFALAVSKEYVRMPKNVTGLVLGKSTYARCGIIANFTPLEAGWHGFITIEISNTTPLPARVYAGEGFAQILFLKGTTDPRYHYGNRPGGGKYQGQKGITLPSM